MVFLRLVFCPWFHLLQGGIGCSLCSVLMRIWQLPMPFTGPALARALWMNKLKCSSDKMKYALWIDILMVSSHPET